ncbi:MAG TPA: tRNA 2-thiouridine(34) synthase MnmA [Candidatus Portnoybacteria bacterium]|nr:tRNA 2-thiouridine(34) synthase MnmA [Candidatus Portnoybacteria bacterium]
MAKKNKNKKVFVGLSGGVDSSVAAALLKKQGYDVVGVFMRFWKDGRGAQNACCSVESEAKALAVAKKLGIPFYIFNFEAEFKKAVVDYFLRELGAGRTPNPCVVCNPQIKFGLFLERAIKMGADYVAMGHYASVKNAQEKAKLFAGKDKMKDQSYFLCGLSQKQLNRVIFPLGGYVKERVYELAKKMRLPHQSHQSFDICFAGDYQAFLKKHLKLKPGKIVDLAGQEAGEHLGLPFYTIGQRASIGGPGPFWVVKKDLKKNILFVSNNEKDLYQKEMLLEKINWLRGQAPKLPLRCKIKIRYSVKSEAGTIRANGSIKKMVVLFDKPQRAITHGQSAVFYGKNGEVLGGGIIKN